MGSHWPLDFFCCGDATYGEVLLWWKISSYLFINSPLCRQVKLLSHVNVFNDLSGVFESFCPTCMIQREMRKIHLWGNPVIVPLVYNVCICISIVLTCWAPPYPKESFLHFRETFLRQMFTIRSYPEVLTSQIWEICTKIQDCEYQIDSPS